MKRKINIRTIALVLLGLMYGQEAISQVVTEEILRDRYWQYRERTRRHFVKIGKEDGESIPIIRIEPEYEMLIIPASKIKSRQQECLVIVQ